MSAYVQTGAEQDPPSLLDGLPDEVRREVRVRARRRRFGRGEVIFHAGDPGRDLHLIEKGHVAIRVTTPLGDVGTFTILGPPATFGDQVLFAEEPTRTASAVAVEGAETLSLTAAQVHELRRGHASVDALLMETLAATVRRLSGHLLEALYLPADRRVVRRLASVASVYSTPTIPVTQEDLAHMAGVSRPTANRVLKELEASGVIEISRGRVDVLDPAGLERASGW